MLSKFDINKFNKIFHERIFCFIKFKLNRIELIHKKVIKYNL
jgi:hypothetical protein